MKRNELLLRSDTTIPETVDWIRKVAVQGTRNLQAQQIAAECLKASDPLKCAFDKVYDLIVYEPCPDDIQSLRTIENMIREQKGNCVNYSTMLASILLLMNVPFFFRTVAYSNPNEYDHIYIVTKSGIVLDPVPGQRQDGTDTRQNRPAFGNYNQEVSYKFKKDYPMPALTVLQGTRKNYLDKNGYPMGFARSRFIRTAKGTLGCAPGCASCSGCKKTKPMGTWLSSVGNFLKDAVVEAVISPVNVTALQITGKNAINYTPATQVGVDYTKAQDFAGQLVNDSVKVGIQSPLTAINTVAGTSIDPFTYNTQISGDVAQGEKKAQYTFVDIIGSIFGVKANNSTLTTKNDSKDITQAVVPNFSPSINPLGILNDKNPANNLIPAPTTTTAPTVASTGITAASLGPWAIGIMALVLLGGGIKTSKTKRK